MIELEKITFQYKNTPVFDKFDWEVKKGDSWAIIGPSGCGKSTLLSILAGLKFPNSGRLLINNQLLTRPRPQTGLIQQDYGLLPWATVRQNVELGLNLRNFYGADGIHAPNEKAQNANIDEWLDRLGLLEIENKYPGQISGGQRQRTAIARTLILHPDLLLMDEPFSSLDAPSRESLQKLTLELAKDQGLTLILVTHSIEEAALLGEQILLLKDPPHQKTVIIENSGAANPDYRNESTYQELCRELRAILAENKATTL